MYLNIFEDGSITQTSNSPSEDDLKCIDSGILDVIIWDEGNQKFMSLDPNASWHEI